MTSLLEHFRSKLKQIENCSSRTHQLEVCMRTRLDEFEQNIKHAIPPCNNKEEGMLNKKIEMPKYKKKEVKP